MAPRAPLSSPRSPPGAPPRAAESAASRDGARRAAGRSSAAEWPPSSPRRRCRGRMSTTRPRADEPRRSQPTGPLLMSRDRPTECAAPSRAACSRPGVADRVSARCAARRVCGHSPGAWRACRSRSADAASGPRPSQPPPHSSRSRPRALPTALPAHARHAVALPLPAARVSPPPPSRAAWPPPP
eukprot:5113869-Prymnesium_polylepis.1